jgi:tetratricopeptide (TPR) repeat protein
MRGFGWARLCAFCVLCLLLGGCFPESGGALDEKREPNFINGKNLVGQMDYQGAIEAFEKALEVDPHSASAHFELGWLYEDKGNDPAAAFYHFERYLALNPNAGNADVVKQRMSNCRMELAKAVSAVGPLAPAAQRELDRVALENKQLEAQLTDLQNQLAQAKSDAKGRAQQAEESRRAQEESRHAVAPVVARVEHVESGHSNGATKRPTPAAKASGRMRSHVVQRGETFAAIARRYSLPVSVLESANPQVRPTHLLAGQTLNIPSIP